MKFIEKLLSKKTQKKAIAFVDYEYWYYTYQKLYGLKPDPLEWRSELEKKYELDNVVFFADFSYKGIGDELLKLNTVTNTIIETQQLSKKHKNDMADFFMLDHIYQAAALKPDIEIFILFTGNPHFQSAIKYITEKLKKIVIVYGIKDALSSQLKYVATECFELPASGSMLAEYFQMIISNFSYVDGCPRIIPTFMGTVSAVAKRNNVPERFIHAALQKMIDEGLIYQREENVKYNKKIRIVVADWEALEKAGLWSYE